MSGGGGGVCVCVEGARGRELETREMISKLEVDVRHRTPARLHWLGLRGVRFVARLGTLDRFRLACSVAERIVPN